MHHPALGLADLLRTHVSGDSRYCHTQHSRSVAEEDLLSDRQFHVVAPLGSSSKRASVLSRISRSFVDPLLYRTEPASASANDRSSEPIQRICSTLSICS